MPSRFVCVCVIQPFSVVVYVIRTVHKFDFRPVIKEAPHKWRPVFVEWTTLWSDKRLMFLTISVCFTPTVVASVKDYPHCAGKLNSVLTLKDYPHCAGKLNSLLTLKVTRRDSPSSRRAKYLGRPWMSHVFSDMWLPGHCTYQKTVVWSLDLSN